MYGRASSLHQPRPACTTPAFGAGSQWSEVDEETETVDELMYFSQPDVSVYVGAAACQNSSASCNLCRPPPPLPRGMSRNEGCRFLRDTRSIAVLNWHTEAQIAVLVMILVVGEVVQPTASAKALLSAFENFEHI